VGNQACKASYDFFAACLCRCSQSTPKQAGYSGAAGMLEGSKTLCHRRLEHDRSEMEQADAPVSLSGAFFHREPLSKEPGPLGRDVMADALGLIRGKRGLIMGVANNRSLAWGIAKACRSHGAEVALTYQGEALKKRVDSARPC
jgi:hypothetical protein